MESDLGKVDYRCDQYRQQIMVHHGNVGKLEQGLEQLQRQLEVKGRGHRLGGVAITTVLQYVHTITDMTVNN